MDLRHIADQDLTAIMRLVQGELPPTEAAELQQRFRTNSTLREAYEHLRKARRVTIMNTRPVREPEPVIAQIGARAPLTARDRGRA